MAVEMRRGSEQVERAEGAEKGGQGPEEVDQERHYRV